LLLRPADALRGAVRFVLLAGVICRALMACRLAPPPTLKARAFWLHRLASRIFALLGATMEVRGAMPGRGLVASNHLSYLDIIVLGTIAPVVFVSKKEVASWPLFGASAICGGTIFVDRERRGAVGPVVEQMRGVLAAGLPLVLFAEGTSSGGETVLPFNAPLFAPVAELKCPVAACALRYELPNANVSEEVCYWRPEHTLAPHLLNLLSKTGLRVTVTFGRADVRSGDRKAIARELHGEAVAALQSPA
jgi:1-acyl-sn-glycerol-3-phosphate acyltransferase